jgi:hypothetical protein
LERKNRPGDYYRTMQTPQQTVSSSTPKSSTRKRNSLALNKDVASEQVSTPLKRLTPSSRSKQESSSSTGNKTTLQTAALRKEIPAPPLALAVESIEPTPTFVSSSESNKIESSKPEPARFVKDHVSQHDVVVSDKGISTEFAGNKFLLSALEEACTVPDYFEPFQIATELVGRAQEKKAVFLRLEKKKMLVMTWNEAVDWIISKIEEKKQLSREDMSKMGGKPPSQDVLPTSKHHHNMKTTEAERQAWAILSDRQRKNIEELVALKASETDDVVKAVALIDIPPFAPEETDSRLENANILLLDQVESAPLKPPPPLADTVTRTMSGISFIGGPSVDDIYLDPLLEPPPPLADTVTSTSGLERAMSGISFIGGPSVDDIYLDPLLEPPPPLVDVVASGLERSMSGISLIDDPSQDDTDLDLLLGPPLSLSRFSSSIFDPLSQDQDASPDCITLGESLMMPEPCLARSNSNASYNMSRLFQCQSSSGKTFFDL